MTNDPPLQSRGCQPVRPNLRRDSETPARSAERVRTRGLGGSTRDFLTVFAAAFLSVATASAGRVGWVATDDPAGVPAAATEIDNTPVLRYEFPDARITVTPDFVAGDPRAVAAEAVEAITDVDGDGQWEDVRAEGGLSYGTYFVREDTDLAIATLVNDGTRSALVVGQFEVDPNDEAATRAALTTTAGRVAQVAQTLRFVEPEPLVAPPGERVDAVFYRTDMQTAIYPSGQQITLSAEILNLLPTGHFTIGLPPTGRSNYNDLPRSMVGTYRIAGNAITLTGADGTVTTTTIDADRDVIAAGTDEQVTRSGLLPDGFRFDAAEEVSRMQFVGDSGANPSVSVGITAGGSFSRTFRPDGTFTEGRSSFARTSAQTDVSMTGSHERNETSARGTYAVRDGLVHLSYDDGRRDAFEVLWIPRDPHQPADPEPPLIWANGGFDMEFATPVTDAARPAPGGGAVDPLDSPTPTAENPLDRPANPLER